MLFPLPSVRLLETELKRAEKQNTISTRSNDTEISSLQLIAAVWFVVHPDALQSKLSIPIHWNRLSLYMGKMKVRLKELNAFSVSPLLERYFHSTNPLNRPRTLRLSEILPRQKK